MKTRPQFFTAAAALRERLLGKFNPDQARDDDGKWSNDLLGVGSRISLADGETLVGSRKVPTTDASESVPVLAAVQDAQGTHVRLGVVAADDADKWAGANRGGTAVLDSAALADLDTTLDAANATARTRAREIQKIWDAVEDAEADLDDARGDDEDPAEVAAAQERLDQAQAAETAWYDAHDPDELIAEGTVTGSAWGDVAFRVFGLDDQAGGWEIQLAVRPHGADGWSWDDVDAPARLDLANWRQMQRQLKALGAGPQNKTGRTVMGSRGRAQARAKSSNAADFRVENRAADVAEIYLYAEIGGWGVTASQFVQELGQVKANTVDLHINSPGGDAFDGVAIYNALVASRKKIRVFVDGLAASIASVIAMAGETVTMGRGSQMMIHDAHGFAVGNVDAMRAYIDLLDRTSADIAGFYASRAGGTAEQWRTRMKAETWYSAEEAVKAGLADDVAAVQTMEQVAADWDLSVFNFAGRTRAPAPAVARAQTAADPAPEGEAGTAQDPQPEPDAEPMLPVFDPNQFKASVTAALDPMPHFDPEAFRHGLHALALDAPAAPAPVVKATAEPDPDPTPDPEPDPVEPEIGGFRPSVFRAALQLGVTTLPALPDPEPAAAPVDEPSTTAIDPMSFVRSLKEAAL